MIRAADVLRLVSGVLQDLEPGQRPRWEWEGGDDDAVGLLDFLNDAIRDVSMQRPDALIVTEPIRLEPGMRQTLPCKKHYATREAATFIELVRNLGSDKETPGPAIQAVDPVVLLAWADIRKTGAVIESFGYDRLVNKDVYHVYPGVPQNCEVWVEASYSARPVKVTSPDEYVPIPDEYAPALKHHILESILSGDNESSSSNAAKAAYHLQRYNSILGIKMQVDAAWPKTKGGA